MFLTIDIGNTSTLVGVFEGDNLKASFRLLSDKKKTVDELGAEIKSLLESHTKSDALPDKIAVCSVVPELTAIYNTMLESNFSVKPLLLSHETDLPFKILYDNPAQVGADRLANAAAVRELYGYPSIVIDLGTATTYDVINSEGNYLGGLILPGLWTSASNLFEKASKLFPVNIEKPKNLIGKDTADSIKSGLYYGFIGQMEFLVDKIKEELSSENTIVIATGGFSNAFSEDTEIINYIDPDLTLKGLKIIFDN
jgi:type III pantothenate kinase